jgi:hypothetical protein
LECGNSSTLFPSLRLPLGRPASALATPRFWFHFINGYSHIEMGQASAPTHHDNYEKTKTPAEAPFFDLGSKNYFATQSSAPQGLKKIRKNSLTKRRSV